MTKELIIFDLYNTLIVDNYIEEQDRYRLNSIWSAIENSGFPIKFSEVILAYDTTKKIMKEYQKKYFSLNIFELVNIFTQQLNLDDITILKKIYDIWTYTSLQYPLILVDFIQEGLQELKDNNKKIALISNTAMTSGIALRFHLKEHHIYNFFDDMVFSDEFGFMKPKKMIFQRVLENLNVSAQQACFVGDHEFYDEYGAKASGIDYVYMCSKTSFKSVIKNLLVKKNNSNI